MIAIAGSFYAQSFFYDIYYKEYFGNLKYFQYISNIKNLKDGKSKSM